jgi:hypothetical protein
MRIKLLSIEEKSKILGFFLCFITALLLGLGTFRIFSFILHDPLLAYANNYDMFRIQSCHQIWPLDPKIVPGEQTPSAPLKYYKLFDKDIRLGGCQPSSELIFTSISASIIKILGLENGFSIQIFGLVRGLLLSICSIGFSLWFLINRKIIASLSNALIYTIVLADPANTLYLNTFYSEFSALFFLYLSLLLLYACLYRKSLTLSLLFGSSLLLLSLSKYQHLALPIGILFNLVMVNWRNLASIKYIAIGAFVGAVVGLICQAYILFQQDNMYFTKFANATDTFLGAVLPAASNLYDAAHILGLPQHCANYSGKSWYSPGFAENHPCPEVMKVSRFKILLLAFKDPPFLVHITDDGIQLLQPWIVNYLGHISNQNFGQITQFSISSWLNKLPLLFLRVAFLIPGLIYVAGYINISKKKSMSTKNLVVLITSIILLMYIVFFSALFGDGYTEFQKHTHLFFSLYIALLIILLVALMRAIIPWIYLLLSGDIFSRINKPKYFT